MSSSSSSSSLSSSSFSSSSSSRRRRRRYRHCYRRHRRRRRRSIDADLGINSGSKMKRFFWQEGGEEESFSHLLFFFSGFFLDSHFLAQMSGFHNYPKFWKRGNSVFASHPAVQGSILVVVFPRYFSWCRHKIYWLCGAYQEDNRKLALVASQYLRPQFMGMPIIPIIKALLGYKRELSEIIGAAKLWTHSQLLRKPKLPRELI